MRIKSFRLFEGHISYSDSYKAELNEIVSTIGDYLSELDFMDIDTSCKIVYPTYYSSNRDLYIEVSLKKSDGFRLDDIKSVIEVIMDYLSDFRFNKTGFTHSNAIPFSSSKSLVKFSNNKGGVYIFDDSQYSELVVQFSR
jgi:hypothetical protein